MGEKEKENALEKLCEAAWRHEKLIELETLATMQRQKAEREKRKLAKEEEIRKLRKIEDRIMAFCAEENKNLL